MNEEKGVRSALRALPADKIGLKALYCRHRYFYRRPCWQRITNVRSRTRAEISVGREATIRYRRERARARVYVRRRSGARSLTVA